ncbi:MAG: nucleotidyl transferase AbiEii/AbiGii toxin family protein [Acidobacteria bacterium]|nr:nucleotidyl transferase AbiEii/AbiGii toxin family protein [Acidobacteriota bacterium]
MQRYAVERFLYRLGKSRYRDRFILKGAALFALWGGSLYRATRDLDFTGYGSPDQAEVLAALREVCAQPDPGDELTFDGATLTAEPIRDDSEYDGLHVRLEGRLGTSRIPVRIDIGFGNAIDPPPQAVTYPTLLDDPPPRIQAYPLEAVIAEKFHAMVVLGERNSRYKDFYDVHVLARQFPFDGARLARSIAATFERRRTVVNPAMPAALGPRFFADPAKTVQWRTYIDRNRLPGAPADFDVVGETLRAFLGPIWHALAGNEAHGSTWNPGGPWTTVPLPTASVPPTSREAAFENRSAHLTAPEAGVTTGPGGGHRERSVRCFKPYPAYRDSAVEWLGEIPAHWEVKPLKRLTAFSTGWTPPTGRQDLYGGEHLWANISDLGPRVLTTTENTISDAAIREARLRIARAGTLLFSFKLSVGTVSIAGVDMYTNEAIAAFAPSPHLDTDYLYWAAPTLVPRNAQDNIYGAPLLNRERIANARLLCPPISEQRTIAAFLDRETARIDALVAKKERLIELLQEKRTALITRAVTKGLDPTVPMKDSGLEWLGEIPAHWEVARLKEIVTGIEQGWSPLCENRQADVGEWGVLKVGCVNGEAFDESEHKALPSELDPIPELEIRPGDILMSRANTVELLGSSALVRTVRARLLLCDKLYRLRVTGACVLPEFVVRTVASRVARFQLEREATGASASMQNISQETIATLLVPLPLIAEQRAIAAFLDRETAKLDALIAKFRDAIDRLKELRTALVSAAVTGKIDVRH